MTRSNPFYPTLKAMVGPGLMLACGDGKTLAAKGVSSGDYKDVVGLLVPEDFGRGGGGIDFSDGDATRAAFLERYYDGWAPELRAVVAASEGRFTPRPLYSMPASALAWRPQADVTLVGDAAHSTTPFVGEGVNCAMTDALVLAGALGRRGLEGIAEAVAEYERDMLPRAVSLVTRSTASGEIIFADDAPRGLVEILASDKSLLAEPFQLNANK